MMRFGEHSDYLSLRSEIRAGNRAAAISTAPATGPKGPPKGAASLRKNCHKQFVIDGDAITQGLSRPLHLLGKTTWITLDI